KSRARCAENPFFTINCSARSAETTALLRNPAATCASPDAYGLIESQLDGAESTHHSNPQRKGRTTNVTESILAEGQEPLADRHYWILGQLSRDVKLTRKQVMEEFGYSIRHAKRVLRTLTERDMIQFQPGPKPGYYVLGPRSHGQNE
ncbi:MAG: hypothetical protein WC058_10115, partial [Phycisphaeraceae bacterium]